MIPELIHAQGTNFDAGVQVGQQLRVKILKYLEITQNSIPKNIRWSDIIDRCKKSLALSEQEFPGIISQYRGIAKGVGISFENGILPFLVEEAFDFHNLPEKCTDILDANSEAAYHNDDLTLLHENLVNAVLWETPDGKVLTIGPAGFMSVGIANINGYLHSLTGNEMSQTDTRSEGIPCMVEGVGILYAMDFHNANEIALDPRRRSSYANGYMDTQGHVLFYEASATNHRILYPGPENNWMIVHANSYVDPEMQPYDATPNHNGSWSRYNRGIELTRKIKNPTNLKKIMRDHGQSNIPSEITICKHGNPDRHTIFSVLFDLKNKTVEIAYGPPCQNEYILYEFK
jgi:hypothetical protein